MGRYVRYQIGGATRYGEVREKSVHPLDGLFGAFTPSREPPHRLEEVKLLAPTLPTKIIAVGPNYGTPPPGMEKPMLWVKPATCVNDPEGTIELPPGHPAINHESELAIVIGKRAKQVDRKSAEAYIFGYTCMNDVTAGDLQTPGAFVASRYFVDGKIFDGFGPLGPWIETDIDVSNLHVECRVNGEIRQSGSTSKRAHTPADLVAMISNVLTLLPGDVISTGSPPPQLPLVDGDVVEVEIEKIGVLRNYCRNRPERS